MKHAMAKLLNAWDGLMDTKLSWIIFVVEMESVVVMVIMMNVVNVMVIP